ncbi:MAG: glycosyltransferase [Gloeomargarita sp. SKYBB_i_bin120]|nr:glycosyltransferase [Gloeomargarita sp. SKYG98]MCS7291955.1 glycosyltransferase [Gloeomargarita sp. SKYB120]MDW8177515.1 glycosyltransferase [Gloeomargarita sp. SKYBB_i_bin120]
MKANKILIINSLSKGGAQRVAVNLLRELGFDYIVVFDRKELPYDIPASKVISLNSPSSKGFIKKFLTLAFRFFKLKELKKRMNVCLSVSLLEPANLLNILTKGKDKVILSFHNYYSLELCEDVYTKDSKFDRKVTLLLYKLVMKSVYNRADLMVAVSKVLRTDLIRNFGIDNRKLITIYNPISLSKIQRNMLEPLGEYQKIFSSPTLLNMGRLTQQKGQWHLLRMLRELKKSFPELKLVILGEGELKDSLVDFSRSLGLRTCAWDIEGLEQDADVYLVGFQKNPFKFIARSTLFVFPSLWEGLPNAILEAMACGLPIVSADCKSGPREILAPETDPEYETKEPELARYGILMPVLGTRYSMMNEPLDEKEKTWVKTLAELLRNEALRKSYSERSIERAKNFDMQKLVGDWKRLLCDHGCS